MARRTSIEVYERRRARRIARKLDTSQLHSELTWKQCGYCGTKFNPIRTRGFRGKVICPQCEEFFTRVLYRLIKLKIVRLRKDQALPRRRPKQNWDWIGEHDEKRPWLRWKRCEFCNIPQCLNNNAERKMIAQTYKGHLICGKCKRLIRLLLPVAIDMKIVKFRKEHRG